MAAADEVEAGAAGSVTLAELLVMFFRIGATAFGGGGSTLSMMHREFCVRRQVLPDEEFQLLFSLSRLVPGINLLSLTVLLGHRAHGLIGALLGLVGLTVPSFTLILLGCLLLRGSHPGAHLAGAMRGLAVGVAALLIETAWRLCHGSLAPQTARARAFWLGLAAGALILTQMGAVHPGWIILGGGALGTLLFTGGREHAR
jgi:chromate transporter